MFTRYVLLAGVALASVALAAPALSNDLSKLPRQQVQLVPPPFVHPHEQATKEGPKVVQFRMTIQEKEMVIDDAAPKCTQ